MLFFLAICFVAAFGSVSAIRKFDIDDRVIEEALEYGVVAELTYRVSNLERDAFADRLFMEKEEDLGLKIWVQLNVCKDDPGKQLMTVVRLDNVDDNRVKILSIQKKITIDYYWREWRGWPNDLVVCLNNQTTITIPANPDFDCMQMEINEGLKFPCLAEDVSLKDEHEFPPIVHQITGQNMKVVDKLIILLKMKNQHWEHRQYSLDDMGPFIEEFEGKRTRRAFDVIVPKAYKADILRLVLLKRFGGVYLDSKLCPLMPFYEFLPQKGNFLVNDRNGGLYNGFMAFRKEDPFLQRYLDQIVTNIENRYYGSTPLSITGPMLLKELFDEWEDKEAFTITAALEFEYQYFRKDGRKVCIYYNSQYRNNQFFDQNDHYSVKWKRSTVYGEERNL